MFQYATPKQMSQFQINRTTMDPTLKKQSMIPPQTLYR